MNRLGRTFVTLFVKNFTQLGWRECDSETEGQLARPLWRSSPIGASDTQWNCANGKRAIFMGILQKVSSGHMKYILKGIQCKCFQVMSLLTGPEISPPMCGKRGNRDGDKLLCNRCPLKHEARERGVKCFTRTWPLKTLPPENLHGEVQLISQVHDVCGMGAAIHSRVHNNLDPSNDRRSW